MGANDYEMARCGKCLQTANPLSKGAMINMLLIGMNALISWPMFASFQEDKLLYNEQWSEKGYDEHLVVIWDMTNHKADDFSYANNQHSRFNTYYRENCFKQTIFVQLCEWLGSYRNWTGFVSNRV